MSLGVQFPNAKQALTLILLYTKQRRLSTVICEKGNFSSAVKVSAGEQSSKCKVKVAFCGAKSFLHLRQRRNIIGQSPHHLPKATSFALTAQHHYGKAVFHPPQVDIIENAPRFPLVEN